MKKTIMALFFLLVCSFAFTASDSYIIHVSESANSRIIVYYSGDLNGQAETPFDLASDTPFTVTLSASSSVPLIESYFEYWIIDGVSQPMDKRSVTVIVDDAASERTARARYAYGTPGPPATPTPTPDQPVTHVIHITSSTFPAGEGNIQITYTGDYSGQGTTPFDIGPYSQPFTITLSAPATAFVSGASNTLIGWNVNGELQYPSPITNLTVSTGTDTPEMNIIAQYAHVEPTPAHTNFVWIEPPQKTVGVSEDFTLEIHLDSGSSRVGAYDFLITWIMPREGAIIYVNTNTGVSGVEAGPDGFVSTVNANDPGNLRINGFDTAGREPGTDLHFLTVHFRSGPGAASTPVDIYVNTLADENANNIGPLDTAGSVVTVVDALPGDVDSDGTISIIDALLVAQYYVGLAPVSFNPAAADVDCDGSITIVDALLIAQYYVGLITQFC